MGILSILKMNINVQDGANQFLKESVHSFKSYSINGQQDITVLRQKEARRPELVIEWLDLPDFCCRG